MGGTAKRVATLTALSWLTAASCTTAQTSPPGAPVPTPAAVFAAYVADANAGDLDAIKGIVAATVTRPPNSRCAPALSDHDCLIQYLDETVIRRHSTLTARSTEVDGAMVSAKVELRNDATRMAGIDRISGTDEVQVTDGKITSFAFVRDPGDAQTAKFFEFMMHGGPPPR